MNIFKKCKKLERKKMNIYFTKKNVKYIVKLGPSGLVIRFIHWNPKGNYKVTSNIKFKISPSTRELLDPKIEESPTRLKFENSDPRPQLDIKF